MMADLSKESREIRRTIHNLMWHMRGSLSREEAWELSPMERFDIEKLIKERMDVVQKTGLPMI